MTTSFIPFRILTIGRVIVIGIKVVVMTVYISTAATAEDAVDSLGRIIAAAGVGYPAGHHQAVPDSRRYSDG